MFSHVVFCFPKPFLNFEICCWKMLKLLTISNLVFFKKPKRLDYELSEVTASLPGGRKVHRTSQSHKTVKLIILTTLGLLSLR